MPTQDQRRPSLLKVLPTPTAAQWAVALRYTDNDSSNKEYRILVDGSTVHFQWGRRHWPGDTSSTTCPSADKALRLARSRWADKERKGYWPITGVLSEHLALPVSGTLFGRPSAITRQIDFAHRAAADQLGSARPGDRLWLVQAPTQEMGSGTLGVQNLTRLGRAGKVLPSTATVTFGQYLVVTAGNATSKLLAEVCPVTVELGARTDTNVRALAETALTLWTDLADKPARQALDEALEISRIVLAL